MPSELSKHLNEQVYFEMWNNKNIVAKNKKKYF